MVRHGAKGEACRHQEAEGSMSYPYHMGLWDKAQHEATMRRIARDRQEAVATYVQQRQPTTPAAPENPCTVSLTPHAAGGAGLGLGQGRLF